MNGQDGLVESSALAALDGVPGVDFCATPIFDGLVEQFEEDPRGGRVPDWEEISYVGDRQHGRRDESGQGVG